MIKKTGTILFTKNSIQKRDSRIFGSVVRIRFNTKHVFYLSHTEKESKKSSSFAKRVREIKF